MFFNLLRHVERVDVGKEVQVQVVESGYSSKRKAMAARGLNSFRPSSSIHQQHPNPFFLTQLLLQCLPKESRLFSARTTRTSSSSAPSGRPSLESVPSPRSLAPPSLLAADTLIFPLPRIAPQARKGGLKDALPEDLLVAVFKATLDRSGIDPKLIEDVAVGNVLPPGGGANVARMALLRAGIPNT